MTDVSPARKALDAILDNPLNLSIIDLPREAVEDAATGLDLDTLLAVRGRGFPGLLEAAIASVPPPDPIELGLGLDGALAETLSLPSGVSLVRPGFDAGGLLMHGKADPKGPKSFLVRRDAGDEVGLVALSEKLAARLEAGPLEAASVVEEVEHDAELRALLEEQLLVPDRWDLMA